MKVLFSVTFVLKTYSTSFLLGLGLGQQTHSKIKLSALANDSEELNWRGPPIQTLMDAKWLWKLMIFLELKLQIIESGHLLHKVALSCLHVWLLGVNIIRVLSKIVNSSKHALQKCMFKRTSNAETSIILSRSVVMKLRAHAMLFKSWEVDGLAKKPSQLHCFVEISSSNKGAIIGERPSFFIPKGHTVLQI